jgi:hypothetical protein
LAAFARKNARIGRRHDFRNGVLNASDRHGVDSKSGQSDLTLPQKPLPRNQ